MPPAAAEGDRPRPIESKRPKAQKHGVHVAASPTPDRFLFSDLPTREVKALIRAALPAGAPVKLVLAVTAKGRWRGWAKITAGDAARAAAVVAKLNGAVVKLTSGAEVSRAPATQPLRRGSRATAATAEARGARRHEGRRDLL